MPLNPWCDDDREYRWALWLVQWCLVRVIVTTGSCSLVRRVKVSSQCQMSVSVRWVSVVSDIVASVVSELGVRQVTHSPVDSSRLCMEHLFPPTHDRWWLLLFLPMIMIIWMLSMALPQLVCSGCLWALSFHVWNQISFNCRCFDPFLICLHTIPDQCQLTAPSRTVNNYHSLFSSPLICVPINIPNHTGLSLLLHWSLLLLHCSLLLLHCSLLLLHCSLAATTLVSAATTLLSAATTLLSAATTLVSAATTLFTGLSYKAGLHEWVCENFG